MLIRAMTPQLLAMDEITTPADVEARGQPRAAGEAAGDGARWKRELASRRVYRRCWRIGCSTRRCSLSGAAGRRGTDWRSWADETHRARPWCWRRRHGARGGAEACGGARG